MKPVVVPVDGSDHALRALAAALDSRLYPHLGEVHLVTVQPPLLRQGLHLGLRQEDIDAYQAEESATALKAARDMLDKAGMPYSVHNEIGAVAECIVNVAQGCQASEIVMGTVAWARLQVCCWDPWQQRWSAWLIARSRWCNERPARLRERCRRIAG